MALDGERFNRQLHPQVKPFISDLAKKQSKFSEEELQTAARVVLGNDRVADGTRRSYDSEAQAAADGVSTVSKAPDGRYYEAVAASPEAIAYVTAELRTGPTAIQTEFNVAQLDKLKYDHKPWQTELENSGLELLNTITVIGSNGAAPTVQGGAGVGRRAGSGVTNEVNGGAGTTASGTANTVSGARLNMQLSAEQAAGTRAPTTITSYSDHAVTQISSRDGGIGVSQAAVNDAFVNPVSIQYVPSKYGPTFKYIGKDATVVVNSEGNAVTTWATNSGGTGK